MREDRLGRFPTVLPDRLGYDHAIEFFITGEVLCGYFCPDDETIGIYSLCPNMSKDLPNIEDVVFTIDHEFIHWILYAFIDDWASTCWDNIARDIEESLLDMNE